MIRHAIPCGVCGGTLVAVPRPRAAAEREWPSPSAERRLLGVLREADGRSVGLSALVEAGIKDPANAIYELERAGHCIGREYAEVATGRRRLLGYRLRGARPLR